jgi:hypothetical protein
MTSESKGIDCTDYDNPNCPKGDNVKLMPVDKTSTDSLHVAMVGCWGVYGWEEEITIKEYNLEEILGKEAKNIAKLMKKVDTIGEVKEYENNLKPIFTQLQKEYKEARDNDGKKQEVVDKFFTKTPEIYGQEKVINGIKKQEGLSALFLAGDNVYSYNTPKDELVNLITSILNGNEEGLKRLPTKRGYKKNRDYSPQQIKEQLSEGFTKLVNGIKAETNIFLGIGNHDIQTCDDLNTQLNYKNTAGWTNNNNEVVNPDPRYGLHGTYYNVIYNMTGYSVNFIIIDTNMFSEDFHCDGVTKYNDKQRKVQIEWVIRALGEGKCKYNIIIGHCPYIANPHKEEKVKNRSESGEEVTGIRNLELETLFDAISANKGLPKVQVYMCADEHNQQFLYDNKYNMCLVVAGSGGTALDYDIKDQRINGVESRHKNNKFGFVGFDFTNDNIHIKYYNCDIKDFDYRVNVNVNGVIKAGDSDPTGRKPADEQ